MEKIAEHKYWWLGENNQHYRDEEIMIKLSLPRCAIRFKVEEDYLSSFQEWVDSIIEIQWLDDTKPSEKEELDVLNEGWTFLKIEEQILDEDLDNMGLNEEY